MIIALLMTCTIAMIMALVMVLSAIQDIEKDY